MIFWESLSSLRESLYNNNFVYGKTENTSIIKLGFLFTNEDNLVNQNKQNRVLYKDMGNKQLTL